MRFRPLLWGVRAYIWEFFGALDRSVHRAGDSNDPSVDPKQRQGRARVAVSRRIWEWRASRAAFLENLVRGFQQAIQKGSKDPRSSVASAP